MAAKFEPGAIARVRSPIGDPYSALRIEYVFVLMQPDDPFDATKPEVRVAPIAPNTSYATSRDVLGGAREGGMPSDFVIEVWNQRAILVEDLDPTSVGRVAQPTLDAVFNLHNFMLGLESLDPKTQRQVGAPLTSTEDLRIAYQGARYDLAERLSHAADELWHSATPADPEVEHDEDCLSLLAESITYRVDGEQIVQSYHAQLRLAHSKLESDRPNDFAELGIFASAA